MSEKQIIVWIAIGILLMGFLFCGIGNVIVGVRRRKRRFCTTLVNARVIDLVFDPTTSEGNASYYCPVFEYYAGGELIRRKSAYGNTKQNFEIGESVELYINPDKPTDIYCEKETNQVKKISVIFNITGIILIVVGAIIGWISSRM